MRHLISGAPGSSRREEEREHVNSLLGVKVTRADNVALDGYYAFDGESIWMCWWSALAKEY